MFQKIDLEKRPFIIAEVGQNHQGSVDTALEYVRVFSSLGADAIKFQTRNNRYLFDAFSYDKSYDSENSFGSTYGEHRERLELPLEALPMIRDECRARGVAFMSTPFDEPSLKTLLELEVDIIKVASFDLGNLPFIDKIGRSKVPTVMSVGGGKAHHIRSSVKQIDFHNTPLAILHCVSEYPCNFDRLGLNNLKKLKSEFPKHIVGLSDHFSGILSGPIAFTEGARVFEKHVTMNRAWKGTDHSFALEPEGFRKFVRDIKRVPAMMPEVDESSLGNEVVFKKLGKSIIVAEDLSADTILSCDNLSGKIFEKTHIPVRESNAVIGRALRVHKKKGEFLTFGDLK